MSQRIEQLAGEIVRLQGELDREIERRRKDLGWKFREGLVEFEHGITERNRRLRLDLGAFVARSSVATVLSAPVIYSLIIPLVLIDGWASLYQAVCFRAYRIPRVRRSQYIVVDRNRLGYLNLVEVLNCLYCEYANGVIAYVREVSSRTEQYWCPIKHALAVTDPHLRYYQFLEYGDAEGYRGRLEEFRRRLRAEGGGPDRFDTQAVRSEEA
ncbi:hypothetical protein [Brevundimonas sp.]|uniref:hypothetical protein n=1 Tax=Brevundimonas sp. TaxID=1871086 RepID=UPI002D1900ED|nr:hypothetical protein [Brevundimonas sp.]HWQ87295.1 hypothetical protein [Brevundimonas sp.]